VRYERTPDFESGTIDHSATSPVTLIRFESKGAHNTGHSAKLQQRDARIEAIYSVCPAN